MQVDRSEGMINLDEVLTFTEAADKWGLADGKTIRKAERECLADNLCGHAACVWKSENLSLRVVLYRALREYKRASGAFF